MKDLMKYQHKIFKQLGKMASVRINGYPVNIQLFGPRGTGKSVIARQYAHKLGLPFTYLNGNSQTSKGDLLGYKNVSGIVVESEFMKFYRDGGVFVLEEMDAMPQDVLIALNTCIDSNIGAFASGMVDRHKDFRLIATSNTYGGGDDNYTARKKIDASTLERFVLLKVNIDDSMEKELFGSEYHTIQWIRHDLECKDFSTRSAVMLIAMKHLGFKEASLMTCFREQQDWWDYEKNKNKVESKLNLKIVTEEEYNKSLDEISQFNFDAEEAREVEAYSGEAEEAGWSKGLRGIEGGRDEAPF